MATLSSWKQSSATDTLAAWLSRKPVPPKDTPPQKLGTSSLGTSFPDTSFPDTLPPARPLPAAPSQHAITMAARLATAVEALAGLPGNLAGWLGASEGLWLVAPCDNTVRPNPVRSPRHVGMIQRQHQGSHTE